MTSNVIGQPVTTFRRISMTVIVHNIKTTSGTTDDVTLQILKDAVDDIANRLLDVISI